MIVDDADMEMEMAKDPFLEAGIAIPAELPYKDEKQREASARDVVGSNEEDGIRDRLRKLSNAIQRRPSSSTLAKIPAIKRLESSITTRTDSIPEVQMDLENENVSTKL